MVHQDQGLMGQWLMKDSMREASQRHPLQGMRPRSRTTGALEGDEIEIVIVLWSISDFDSDSGDFDFDDYRGHCKKSLFPRKRVL
ncbi:MAG: hypothetical protein EA399_16735 [Desulfovibrionales bacterium]|nr:MAG: hypothetical protein EA399_16735 [Desulfovibrionales bacterium]